MCIEMEALAKIAGFVAFIILGYILRRCNVLKADTVHAISGLLLYVTLPCLVMVSLNGIEMKASFFGLIILGVLANLVMVVVGMVWQRKNPTARTFAAINLAGYNIGTFAMPFLQSFLSPLGFLSICMFDIGNALMCTGTTYSIAVGSEGSRWDYAKSILSRLATSGPIWAYGVMMIMALLHLSFPKAVLDVAQIGANANAFLAMIMIGQGINLMMRRDQVIDLFKLLFVRLLFSAVISAAFYYLLPFDEEIRRALAILAFAPIPAVAMIFSIKAKCDVKMAANFNSLSVAASIPIVSALIMF